MGYLTVATISGITREEDSLFVSRSRGVLFLNTLASIIMFHSGLADSS